MVGPSPQERKALPPSRNTETRARRGRRADAGAKKIMCAGRERGSVRWRRGRRPLHIKQIENNWTFKIQFVEFRVCLAFVNRNGPFALSVRKSVVGPSPQEREVLPLSQNTETRAMRGRRVDAGAKRIRCAGRERGGREVAAQQEAAEGVAIGWKKGDARTPRSNGRRKKPGLGGGRRMSAASPSATSASLFHKHFIPVVSVSGKARTSAGSARQRFEGSAISQTRRHEVAEVCHRVEAGAGGTVGGGAIILLTSP